MINLENVEKFLVITDSAEIKRAVKVNDVLNVIWQLQQHLRSELKYNEKLSEVEYKTIETLRDKFYEILHENNIDMDELYS